MHFSPPAIAFRVLANLSDGVVHDRKCVSDDGVFVPLGVRSLVDAGESDKPVANAIRAQAMGCGLADGAIDGEPAADISPEMSGRRARNEARTLSQTVASTQASGDDTQCANAWLRELEDRRRRGVDVAIHESHVDADIAPCEAG